MGQGRVGVDGAAPRALLRAELGAQVGGDALAAPQDRIRRAVNGLGVAGRSGSDMAARRAGSLGRVGQVDHSRLSLACTCKGGSTRMPRVRVRCQRLGPFARPAQLLRVARRPLDSAAHEHRSRAAAGVPTSCAVGCMPGRGAGWAGAVRALLAALALRQAHQRLRACTASVQGDASVHWGVSA